MGVGNERVSKIVGYKLATADFSEVSPNLPQKILIIGEGNTANQATMPLGLTEVNSAADAGNKYGFGSPIYNLMRILRPISGGGIGGIKTVVAAQESPGGATAKTMTITPAGTASGNGTHTVVINGRRGIDGQNYDVNINTGDTVADINTKIVDVVNNVLGAPVTASVVTTTTELVCKWAGLTSQELNISIDTNGDALGLTYAVDQTTAGAGTPAVTASLDLMGSQWFTVVLNSYGTVGSILDELEAFNGIPDPTNPTGRFDGIIMKPFIAITGSTLEDPSTETNTRRDNVTVAIAPAPLSNGFGFEAAANVSLLYARQAQNAPHLDISGSFYSDMPTPSAIGDMESYNNRDIIVQKGCSTVELISGRYKVADFVTTYHPIGELIPQFRYVRSLTQDFNIRFGYFLQEQQNVVDHVIANDGDIVNAEKVIKPKIWKALLNNYADDLANRGIISDPGFLKESLEVSISTTNPDRFETRFRYKRSSFTRIASTIATAGFNFGSTN